MAKASFLPRVLVVDDEEHITELVAMALGYNGFDVERVASGRAALQSIDAHPAWQLLYIREVRFISAVDPRGMTTEKGQRLMGNSGKPTNRNEDRQRGAATFKTSLRRWQAQWKAQKAAQAFNSETEKPVARAESS